MAYYPMPPAQRARLNARLGWMIAREQRLIAREQRLARKQEMLEQLAPIRTQKKSAPTSN